MEQYAIYFLIFMVGISVGLGIATLITLNQRKKEINNIKRGITDL